MPYISNILGICTGMLFIKLNSNLIINNDDFLLQVSKEKKYVGSE